MNGMLLRHERKDATKKSLSFFGNIQAIEQNYLQKNF